MDMMSELKLRLCRMRCHIQPSDSDDDSADADKDWDDMDWKESGKERRREEEDQEKQHEKDVAAIVAPPSEEKPPLPVEAEPVEKVKMKFVDVVADKRTDIVLAETAPPWRVVCEGLALEGICRKQWCQAFGERVLMMCHFGAYTLGRDPALCPMCHGNVTPLRPFFWRCEVVFKGVKSDGTEINTAPKRFLDVQTYEVDDNAWSDDASSGSSGKKGGGGGGLLCDYASLVIETTPLANV